MKKYLCINCAGKEMTTGDFKYYSCSSCGHTIKVIEEEP